MNILVHKTHHGDGAGATGEYSGDTFRLKLADVPVLPSSSTGDFKFMA